jgi:hypothetical protein
MTKTLSYIEEDEANSISGSEEEFNKKDGT